MRQVGGGWVFQIAGFFRGNVWKGTGSMMKWTTMIGAVAALLMLASPALAEPKGTDATKTEDGKNQVRFAKTCTLYPLANYPSGTLYLCNGYNATCTDTPQTAYLFGLFNWPMIPCDCYGGTAQATRNAADGIRVPFPGTKSYVRPGDEHRIYGGPARPRAVNENLIVKLRSPIAYGALHSVTYNGSAKAYIALQIRDLPADEGPIDLQNPNEVLESDNAFSGQIAHPRDGDVPVIFLLK